MSRLLFFFIFAVSRVLSGCSNGGSENSLVHLSASEFAAKIKELPSAPIIDVRTPGEFSNGHIENAINMDGNESDFKQQIFTLDKTKPVFVYCLSGTRSAEAAGQMRSAGFNKVYELKGGILKWRAADLPETNGNSLITVGMSMQQFEALIQSGDMVLVDFYANWCAPCKKMKPYLDEIATDLAGKVVVIRVNVEEHPLLCKELKIDALPVLHLYKSNNLIWTNTGFIDKDDVLEQLAKASGTQDDF